MNSQEPIVLELDVSKASSDMLVALETLSACHLSLKIDGQFRLAPLCLAYEMQLQTAEGDVAKLTINRNAIAMLMAAASAGRKVELRG